MSGRVKTIATEDSEFTEEIESKTARLPLFFSVSSVFSVADLDFRFGN